MEAEDKSDVERLRSEAAKHEKNAGIIRGSMPSKPSQDDFQQVERIQRELDLAKDKRVLADRMVNERINGLQDYFQKQTGCTVSHDWKIDSQCYRFYFESEEGRGWLYILDLHQFDIGQHDVPELIQQLNAASWQQVLKTYSPKRVPLFKDGKFSDPATFQEWPKRS